MEADRTSPADGCPGRPAGGRSPRHQRHRARAEERLSLVRLPARLWSSDNDLQPLCALGAARVWESLFRELAGNGRSTDTQMIDSTHVKAHRSAAGGKGGSRSRLLAARAEGATRRFTHSQMLKGALSPSC